MWIDYYSGSASLCCPGQLLQAKVVQLGWRHVPRVDKTLVDIHPRKQIVKDRRVNTSTRRRVVPGATFAEQSKRYSSFSKFEHAGI